MGERKSDTDRLLEREVDRADEGWVLWAEDLIAMLKRQVDAYESALTRERPDGTWWVALPTAAGGGYPFTTPNVAATREKAVALLRTHLGVER